MQYGKRRVCYAAGEGEVVLLYAYGEDELVLWHAYGEGEEVQEGAVRCSRIRRGGLMK